MPAELRSCRALPECVGAIVLLTIPATAHALYLDPGTGSLVLQVVAAGVLSAVLVFRNSWRWIKSTLFRMRGRSKTNSDDGGIDP